MFSEAADLYETAVRIDGGNTHAKNHLTLCYYFLKNYKRAGEIALSVLAEDEDNLFALSNYCLVTSAAGKRRKYRQAVEKLLAYETDDMAELFKIASTLCETGEHREGARYLYRIHRVKPYDIHVMMLIAIAEYNSGNLENSLKFFVKCRKLFEDDPISVFFIGYINGIRNGTIKNHEKTLLYGPVLPVSESEKRIKMLTSYLALGTDELVKKWRTGDLKEICEWALYLGDDELAVSVVRLVGRMPACECVDYLRSKLVHIYSGNILGKEIIKILVRRGETRAINYLYDDIFTTVVPKYPKILADMPDVFRDAYALAFAVLCFVTEKFERKLKRVYEAMLKAVSEKEGVSLVSAPAIAAVLCFKIAAGELMSKKDFLCEVFETDIRTFNRYLAALS
jgi:tetratricopeptide (TPR) repeat protein